MRTHPLVLLVLATLVAVSGGVEPTHHRFATEDHGIDVFERFEGHARANKRRQIVPTIGSNQVEHPNCPQLEQAIDMSRACLYSMVRVMCPVTCASYNAPALIDQDVQAVLQTILDVAQDESLGVYCNTGPTLQGICGNLSEAMCTGPCAWGGTACHAVADITCSHYTTAPYCGADPSCLWNGVYCRDGGETSTAGIQTSTTPGIPASTGIQTSTTPGIPASTTPPVPPSEIRRIEYQPVPLPDFEEESQEECFDKCESIRERDSSTACQSVYVGEVNSERSGECHLSPLAYDRGGLSRINGLRFFARVETFVCAGGCYCVNLTSGGQQVDCDARGLISVPRVDPVTTSSFILDNNHDLGGGALQSNSFTGLSQLLELYLRNCSISEIQPGTFDPLTRLNLLDLSRNLLSDFRAGGLTIDSGLNLLPISIFDLSFNSYTYLTPSLLDVLPSTVVNLGLRGMAIDRIVGGTLNTSRLSSLGTLSMTAGEHSSCQVLGDQRKVSCICADGFSSTSGDYCEQVPSEPEVPTVEIAIDTTTTIFVPSFGMDVAPKDPSTLTAKLLVLPCDSTDCAVYQAPSSTTYLCCDAACPSVLVPNCSSFRSGGGNTVSLSIPGAGMHVAAIELSNAAGVAVRSNHSSPFRVVDLSVGSSSADSNGVSTTVLISIILAIVATVSIVVIVYRIKEYRKKYRPASREALMALVNGDSNTDGVAPGVGGKQGGDFVADVLPTEIPRKNVLTLGSLGSGQFGAVGKAMLNGWKSLPSFVVAVKEAKLESDAEELLREAVIMSQFQHPYVLGCIGIITRGETAIVMEYAEHGDLKHFLSKSTLMEILTGVDLLSICADIAQGCAHLHEKGYIHRDIAARNILISADFIFKICDFGLGRKLNKMSSDGDYYKSESSRPFPLRWTAPEAFLDKHYSRSSDIWSWAILGVEVFTGGARPYAGMLDKEVWVHVKDGHRIQRPESCSPEAWARVFEKCFATKPSDRPSFPALVKALTESLGSNIHSATAKLLAHSSAFLKREMTWRSIAWRNVTPDSWSGGDSGHMGTNSGHSLVSASGETAFSVESGNSRESRLSSANLSVSKLTGSLVSHDYAYAPQDMTGDDAQDLSGFASSSKYDGDDGEIMGFKGML